MLHFMLPHLRYHIVRSHPNHVTGRHLILASWKPQPRRVTFLLESTTRDPPLLTLGAKMCTCLGGVKKPREAVILTVELHPLPRHLGLSRKRAVMRSQMQTESPTKSCVSIARSLIAVWGTRSFSATAATRPGIRHVINRPFRSTSLRSKKPHGSAETA